MNTTTDLLSSVYEYQQTDLVFSIHVLYTTMDLVWSIHEYHHGSCFFLLWYHRTVEHIQRVCSKKSCIVDNEKNNSQITGQNEHIRDQLIQCLI